MIAESRDEKVNDIIKKPIFFERNRVGRVYRGGKLFSRFFGDEPVDGFMPEEWIASSVKALNKEIISEKEGISIIEGTDIYFDDLLHEYPLEMLGTDRKMRILVKVLDSAVRLPAQAHPDKVFSKEYFNSEYGKTESWIILDTRADAKIYFGFKDGVDEQQFVSAIDESEYEKESMEKLMEYTIPEKGDIYLVPAKAVHAIGAGCLILEVQEPTDFTIQPEYWCGDYELSENEMYMGLSKEDAIKCFDFRKTYDTKLIPKVLENRNGIKVENLVGSLDTDCFIINRVTLDEGQYKLNIKNSYGVYIVTEGNGRLVGAGYEREITQGNYFFVSACSMDKFYIEGSIQVVECY